jgi:hypothetical protein
VIRSQHELCWNGDENAQADWLDNNRVHVVGLYFTCWGSLNPCRSSRKRLYLPAKKEVKDASTEVLQALDTIAGESLKLDIRGGTKQAVRTAQKEIQQILASRIKKK